MRPGAPLPPERAAGEGEPESEANLLEYAKRLRRHWKLVAVACALTLTGAAIHYAITPKEYMASATLQIERKSLSPLDSSQTAWLENWWNQEYYPTQYELLKSRGLAERVVRNLRLAEDPKYNPGGTDLPLAGRGAAPTADDDRAELGRLANQIRGGLAIQPIGNTQLVVVSYRSPWPEETARLANGFAESFIDLGIESRFDTAGKASTFLSSQIETLKTEIAEKEQELHELSRRTDIVSVEPGSNPTLQRLEAFNSDYVKAMADRFDKEARYNALVSAPPETVADTLSGGLVSELRRDQLVLERDYEIKLKTFKPEFPTMVELKARIDGGRKNLDTLVQETLAKARQSAHAEYQAALRQERSLAAEISSLKGEAIDENSASIQYNNLKVEIETRRDLMDELLRKQSETDVTVRLQNTRESNVRIIDYALVPGGPFRPSLRQDLSLGLVLGLLLGIGAAFLIEYLDRTVKNAEEAERILGLPALAVIPDIAESGAAYSYYRRQAYGARTRGGGAVARRAERKKAAAEAGSIELLPHTQPRLAVSEAYRSLRTALLLSSADEIRVIAVTSAEAGEGKTATISNLSVVMAQLGRRVLLVDSDLRKPRLHEVFHLSNRLGLVSHLTGGADAESIFLRTEIPGLSVTPSGPIPPNPSELLASERMREWIKLVRSRFDVVLIDTPPALAVTDATLVGSMVDGVVLCLRAGEVTREDARACRDRLRLADVKILGFVLNRYRSLAGSYSRRYRHYEVYSAAESEPHAGSAA